MGLLSGSVFYGPGGNGYPVPIFTSNEFVFAPPKFCGPNTH